MSSPFQLSFFNTLARWLNPPPKRPSSQPRVPRESNQDLHLLWRDIRTQFFPESSEIDSYVVCWSRRRQRRVLASCHIERREVHVAQELAHEDHQRWLGPVLYHEMCHAVLGKSVTRRSGKRLWHGPEFKNLLRRHPLTPALEDWMRHGGWLSAVRSHRARATAAKRRTRLRT